MNDKLTNSVMDRVVHYEQQRAKRWWWVFWTLVGAILLGLVGTVVSIVIELREDRTLSILNTLKEDGVVISQVWRDIIGVIWEDLSHYKIYTFAVLVIVVIIGVRITRHRRRAMHRAQRDIVEIQGKK